MWEIATYVMEVLANIAVRIALTHCFVSIKQNIVTWAFFYKKQ
jgi:hypothetical protein